MHKRVNLGAHSSWQSRIVCLPGSLRERVMHQNPCRLQRLDCPEHQHHLPTIDNSMKRGAVTLPKSTETSTTAIHRSDIAQSTTTTLRQHNDLPGKPTTTATATRHPAANFPKASPRHPFSVQIPSRRPLTDIALTQSRHGRNGNLPPHLLALHPLRRPLRRRSLRRGSRLQLLHLRSRARAV